MTNLEIDHAMLRAFVGSRDFKQCRCDRGRFVWVCKPRRELPFGCYEHRPWLKNHVNPCTVEEL